MQTAERSYVTEDDYLASERLAATKSELVNGKVIATAGASPKHNAIAANVSGALRALLKAKRSLVLTSDQRIHCPQTGLYNYPDVTIVCGPLRFHETARDTLLNPVVLVEVLSPSTEDYDREAKFAHYRTIASLREYVIVHQTQERVEHHQRLESGQWLLTDYQGLDTTVLLPSLDCQVPLTEIYDKLALLDDEAV